MEESEENMSSDDVKKYGGSSGVKKPKKRSIVERELETNLTAHVTSPVTYSDATNISRYGRARKLKSDDGLDKKPIDIKSPGSENTPLKSQSPSYKMRVGNSPYKPETPKRALETTAGNQIDNIYQENISLSRFNSETSPSPKKSKVYIRKDLLQTKEVEDNIMLIKNLFASPKSSPRTNSAEKFRSGSKRNSIDKLNNSVEKLNNSIEKKYVPQSNGFDNTSVVKTLDFDSKNRRKDRGEIKVVMSKNELFEIEARCPFQVGDLAWARMGTFPFWPCIVTRDPFTGMFVKKKLFGRVEHDIIHVIFFGDNGRRSWIMDNMLRVYLGQLEFVAAREKFSSEDKKKDPRLYAAYFISEKKQALWNTSVEEAEMLMKEPKRLRIDILNDMILKARASKKQQRSGKIARTGSDVSLSESLYDSLFSEDDTKTDEGRLRNRPKNNKSLDVSDVVTACLDNMAAKTGMPKIQRQSHMDRWLQKAKSKTPEKIQVKPILITPKVEKTKPILITPKVEKKVTRSNKSSRKKVTPKTEFVNPYSLRRSNESLKTFNNAMVCVPDSPTYTQPLDEDIKPAIQESLVDCSKDVTQADFSDINVKKELIDQEHDKEQTNNNSVTIEQIDLDKSDSKDKETSINKEKILSPVKNEVEINVEKDVNTSVIEVSIDGILKDVGAQNKDKVTKKAVKDVEIIDEVKENGKSKLDSIIIIDAEDSDSVIVDDKDVFSNNNLSTDKDDINQTPNNLHDQNSKTVNFKSPNKNQVNGSQSLLDLQSIDTKNDLNSKDDLVLRDQGKVDDKEKDCNMSVDDPKTDDTVVSEKDVSVNEKNLNENGNSESILPINGEDLLINEVTEAKKPKENFEQLEPMLDKKIKKINNTDSTYNSVSVPDKKYDKKQSNVVPKEVNEIKNVKKDVNESKNVKKREEITNKQSPNTQKDINKSITDDEAIKCLSEDNEYDTEETSDDEPSPEYEPLCDDITEDFRNHMKTIESSVTDKKDEQQIVMICTKIIEEIKKASPVKQEIKTENTSVDEIKLEKVTKVLDVTENKIKVENNQITRRTRNSAKKLNEQFNDPRMKSPVVLLEPINGEINFKDKINDHGKRDHSKVAVKSVIKDNNLIRSRCNSEAKVVIIPLEQTKAYNSSQKSSVESVSKVKKESPKSDNKFKLSLKRNKTKSNDPPTQEKTTKNKISQEVIVIDDVPKGPKVVLIEKTIPERKQNGYHHKVDRKFTDTPDNDDDDFDIDAISLNSEDSAVSLHTIKPQPTRRSLRSKPHYDNGLENPEFLKYLELRQDYLIDEHPELSQDEIVTYLYKTWLYEENLKSDAKKSDDVHQSNLVKGIKQETPPSKKSKKTQPKNRIENYFRDKYNKKKIDFDSESGSPASEDCAIIDIKNKNQKATDIIKKEVKNEKDIDTNEVTPPLKPAVIDLTTEVKLENTEPKLSIKLEEAKETPKVSTPKKRNRSKTNSPRTPKEKEIIQTELKQENNEAKDDMESVNSEDSEVPLRKLRSKVLKENKVNGNKSPELDLKKETEDTVSIISVASDDEPLLNKLKKKKNDKRLDNGLQNPEFLKFLELRQDAIMDENPQLSQEEIVDYLYKTWLYEETYKSEFKKNDEIEQSNLVKGLNQDPIPKKVKRKPKTEKVVETHNVEEVCVKEKPRRKTIQPYYNEEYSDIEEELEVFEIFQTKKAPITVVSKADPDKNVVKTENEVIEIKDTEEPANQVVKYEQDNDVEIIDEIELYFTELTKPKPNVFKGLNREKVCEICEYADNLYKCKGCNGMFHVECVKRAAEVMETPTPVRGRKKKKKLGRKYKSIEDSEGHSDDKSQDISEEMHNVSADDVFETITFDAETIESQLSAKMQEIMNSTELQYDSFSSDNEVDWSETVAGKCEIVDVKVKPRPTPVDAANFKCNNCQKYDTPICFVCKAAVTKNGVKVRQKCHVAHCHKFYHLECLDHWPQTQFNSGEPSRNNKKINEYFEAMTCPRHVCHTCVCDDPRGCKTRFSGDKLARCVRCPATYHSFTKCLPAGSVILSASQIICPRHYQLRPGKVPCHVNTGWCFICALGGSLICCEYCPTSFHAECLNIKPPEGNYMCEDCETGRLPLYGEMVWVKLGHYRWWPGVILHPCEIPENIMAVKHSLGEFVVRFFGQYDHYWVNRGRVFPYQEGDSGRISSQKSKIDAAFTTAMEHAQRAFEILKKAQPNEEESLDIASSLLPPHFVKLKSNKPCGALCGRRPDDPALSLTQCDCDPTQDEPCGPYSQCLNRMLLTECGPMCRAGDRCNNRAFEKRLYPKLVPYRTPHRGWGLKTLEDIKAGQFVIEYVGELIDEEEFKRRMRRKHEIRDENFYFLTLDKERMIDAGPKGNFARFMNHCCEPNCETQKWTVLGDVRVGLFAIDDIPANSEVTFNYNLECAGIEKKRCLCGAKRCSGYIGAKPKQDEPRKGKDGKPIQKRTYKKRNKNNEDSPSTNKNKPKRPIGRPPKPRELTEIEKDLLIINSATNSVCSVNSTDDSNTQTSDETKNKSLKRKRNSNSTENSSNSSESKRQKCEVGD